MSVHFSSKTDEWATPQDLFDALDARYNFELDVCATDDNAKCGLYFTKEEDGLSQQWSGVCWMNPPYGREIGRWIKKAYQSAQDGATVVCLIPARTCTRWWHDYVVKGDVTFLRGRLKFGGAKTSAPFPSAIVVFSPVTITDTFHHCALAAGFIAKEKVRDSDHTKRIAYALYEAAIKVL